MLIVLCSCLLIQRALDLNCNLTLIRCKFIILSRQQSSTHAMNIRMPFILVIQFYVDLRTECCWLLTKTRWQRISISICPEWRIKPYLSVECFIWSLRMEPELRSSRKRKHRRWYSRRYIMIVSIWALIKWIENEIDNWHIHHSMIAVDSNDSEWKVFQIVLIAKRIRRRRRRRRSKERTTIIVIRANHFNAI